MGDQRITIDHIAGFMTELRATARNLLRREKDAASLRPTALVNSALLRNKPKDIDWSDLSWENRKAFFSAMHGSMRRALIDHARKRMAARRPPLRFVDPQEVNLYDLPGTAEYIPEIMVALDESIHWLEKERSDLLHIVNHHYFSGLTISEISAFVGLSEKTIKRRLAEARLLLHANIQEYLGSSRGEKDGEGPR